MPSAFPAVPPRSVLLRKWPSTVFTGYGFNLVAEKGKKGHFIGLVDEGSPAKYVGLIPGDRIIEVNNTNIESVPHSEVIKLIKQRGDEVQFLVVDPACFDWCLNNKVRIGSTMTQPSVRRSEVPMNPPLEVLKSKSSPPKSPKSPSATSQNGASSPLPRANLLPPRICIIHQWPDAFKGFGFNLQTNRIADSSMVLQIIGKVDEFSPAHSAGVLVDDIVIEVNGFNINNENHSQIVERIRHGGTSVEFLLVRPETWQWCRSRGVVISSKMTEFRVQTIECPKVPSRATLLALGLTPPPEDPTYSAVDIEKKHEQEAIEAVEKAAASTDDVVTPPPPPPPLESNNEAVKDVYEPLDFGDEVQILGTPVENGTTKPVSISNQNGKVEVQPLVSEEELAKIGHATQNAAPNIPPDYEPVDVPLNETKAKKDDSRTADENLLEQHIAAISTRPEENRSTELDVDKKSDDRYLPPDVPPPPEPTRISPQPTPVESKQEVSSASRYEEVGVASTIIVEKAEEPRLTPILKKPGKTKISSPPVSPKPKPAPILISGPEIGFESMSVAEMKAQIHGSSKKKNDPRKNPGSQMGIGQRIKIVTEL